MEEKAFRRSISSDGQHQSGPFAPVLNPPTLRPAVLRHKVFRTESVRSLSGARDKGRVVGKPSLGITSRLPVTWRRGDLGYCRGFAVFGACAARLYSASVSAITSVRPPSPGCSMMLITS